MSRMPETAAARRPRQANWDLLRGLSMLLVVAVHTLPTLPRFQESRLGAAAAGFCMVCDPVFFMLSGYFAIRPLRGSLGSYVLRKASTVLMPLVVYSLVLYVTLGWPSLSPGGYLACLADYLSGGWWFVPALVPFLLLAPFLYQMLEGLDDRWIRRLAVLCLSLFGWGAISHLLAFLAGLVGRPGVSRLVTIGTHFVPTEPLRGYFPVFVMGYLYRRLSATLSERARRRAACAGLGALALSAVCAGLGVPQDDPNQLWVLAAFGLMFAFEFARVPEGAATRAAVWVGKRSFSIYLLHYYLVLRLLGATPAWTGAAALVSDLPLSAGVALAALLVLGVFALTLLLASVLDPLVLAPAQRLFDRLAGAALPRLEKRDVA